MIPIEDAIKKRQYQKPKNIDTGHYPKKNYAIFDVSVKSLSGNVEGAVAKSDDSKVTICGDSEEVEALIRFLDSADEIQKLVRAARGASQSSRRAVDTLLREHPVKIRNRVLGNMFDILRKRLEPFAWVSEIDPEDGAVLKKD